MRKIASLLSVLMLLCTLALGQTRTVSGTVRDENANPVPFATITEVGTKNATTADANGNFSIKVKEGAELTISATGFRSINVSSSGNLQTIGLVRGEGQLTEVVVTALQTRRNKNDVVYANQVVRNEELNEVVNKSALNALQGKVAGVKIGQASGAPGASTRVVLRGESSLTQGNNALIVVDGVPLNNSAASGGGGTGKLGDRDNYVDFGNRANDINPDDIESISVLKGPAATSLYGSRGASGVILITTKKGKATRDGKPRISVGSSISADIAYLVMKQQKRFGSGYATCFCSGSDQIYMGENFSWGPELDGHSVPWTSLPVDEHGDPLPLNNGKIEQLVRPYSYVKNHLASFFDTGMTNRNNVSIDGGNGKYSYFLSYTNYNNKGIVHNTNYRKNNLLFNGSANFTDKLSSTVSINYSKVNQRGATEGGYPFGYSSGTPAYSFALQTPVNIPFQELRDYNSPYHDFKGFYGQYSINPYFILDQQKVLNSVDNVLASMAVNYNLFKNFTLTGRASTNFSTSGVTENNPQFSYFRAYSFLDGTLTDFGSPRENLSVGGYKESLARRVDVNFDLLGTYSSNIGRDFKITATAGMNSVQNKAQIVTGTTSGGLVIPGFYDLSNSKSKAIATNASSKYRLLGTYLNASGGYKNFLFLEYSARNDWSSTLPEGKRGFFYQAGGFSFIPTNVFDLGTDVISWAKLRGNVGSTGKDAPLYRLDNYFTLNPTILDYGDDYQIALPFNGQAGAQRSNSIGNPNLKPELTVTYEAGLDLGLLKDRVTIEYTYYYADSKNQIVDVNVPWSTGYSVIPLNVGHMVNRGHELGIRATPIRNKLIDWKVFFTFAKNNNEVKSVAEEYDLDELNIYTGLVHFSGHGTMNLVAAKGKPFGTYKGTDFVYDPSGNIVVTASGVPKQSSTQQYLGSYQPDFITSFGTDFNIKGFSLHALLDARKGGLFFSGSKMSTEYNGTVVSTLINNREPFVIPGSVQEDGTGFKANTVKTNAYQYLAKNLPASGYLVDASYLKWRELSLSYSLQNKLLSQTPFAAASISLFAKNLKYWLPKENVFADPEVGGVGGASDAVGIETTTTPSTRSLGVELRFTLK